MRISHPDPTYTGTTPIVGRIVVWESGTAEVTLPHVVRALIRRGCTITPEMTVEPVDTTSEDEMSTIIDGVITAPTSSRRRRGGTDGVDE
jgi:hypothetical protein